MNRMSLLENGIDSLRKGIRNFIGYNNEKCIYAQKVIYIKDSIIFFHHGIEIIIKHILFKKNEFLVYSQIDDNVIKAYKQMRQENKNSVFETNLVDKIHTVTFEVALERLINLLGYEINDSLKRKLLTLNKIRNRIIHSEIIISDSELIELFYNFFDDLNEYFYNILGAEYSNVLGYEQLQDDFESVRKYLIENEQEYLIKIYEIVKDIFVENGKTIAIGDCKIIDDINFATQILNVLVNNNIELGGDFYDYSCSGEITGFSRIGKNNMRFFTKDNGCYYSFKFKKMLIYLPPIDKLQGVIFYIECDEDDGVGNLDIINQEVGNSMIRFQCCKTKDEYEEYKFLTKGMVAFINTQPQTYEFIDLHKIIKANVEDLYLQFMKVSQYNKLKM